MADVTILISVIDATGCVLRIYQMDSDSSMKQLITHFQSFACPMCTENPKDTTLWHEDTQIDPLHTPLTLELPPFTKMTVKPSILCSSSTTALGHTLPILHHFSHPLVRIHGGTFTATPIGGPVFPFGPMGLYGLDDRDAGWERRKELRMKITDLRRQEKNIIRKIVVGSVYEKYAANGEAVREGIRRLVEERGGVGERAKVAEKELESEGRRDSGWFSLS
ncbi:hypothetical protein DOTSEDRAFT_27272 [Dothistroma septosporum NZE10]|uniref:Uncharacterized protein n=1 Tax=Dothistroma septosporum (strain NZE10 / CBS 128990) TaxID=675120 RepID=N1PGH0_DOTSN|nr:hypothetical protein DOTSEDRAFT_27272 [Dothistroma septosporum NZE10]